MANQAADTLATGDEGARHTDIANLSTHAASHATHVVIATDRDVV